MYYVLPFLSLVVTMILRVTFKNKLICYGTCLFAYFLDLLRFHERETERQTGETDAEMHRDRETESRGYE